MKENTLIHKISYEYIRYNIYRSIIKLLKRSSETLLYIRASLVSQGLWPQFLIFQKNSCAQTSKFLIFRLCTRILLKN